MYKQTCPTFAPEGDIITLDSKQTWPLLWKETHFIFQGFSYVNTIEKVIWTKSCECLFFIRCAEMQETCGKLSPDVTSSQKIRSINILWITQQPRMLLLNLLGQTYIVVWQLILSSPVPIFSQRHFFPNKIVTFLIMFRCLFLGEPD